MSREELFSAYASSTCLVFPSRVETWGLPISEYIPCGKPMIIADLPYAHESAAGASKVAFFPAESPGVLSELMEDVLHGRLESFAPVFSSACRPPRAESWKDLFDFLLSEKFLPCTEE
jgi:glycosyltransferase involved in cell wall biosynthesis